jgi:hypothetical protein
VAGDDDEHFVHPFQGKAEVRLRPQSGWQGNPWQEVPVFAVTDKV